MRKKFCFHLPFRRRHCCSLLRMRPAKTCILSVHGLLVSVHINAYARTHQHVHKKSYGSHRLAVSRRVLRQRGDVFSFDYDVTFGHRCDRLPTPNVPPVLHIRRFTRPAHDGCRYRSVCIRKRTRSSAQHWLLV